MVFSDPFPQTVVLTFLWRRPLIPCAPEASRGCKVLTSPETKENSHISVRAEHLRTAQVDVRETGGSPRAGYPAETSTDTVVWQPEYEHGRPGDAAKNKNGEDGEAEEE